MEKQIEEMDLATLNCFRNKYYSDGNATENGLVANSINAVLPILVSVKNGDYRKQSEVAKEIFEKIDRITMQYLDDKDYTTGEMVYDLDNFKHEYMKGGEA